MELRFANLLCLLLLGTLLVGGGSARGESRRQNRGPRIRSYPSGPFVTRQRTPVPESRLTGGMFVRPTWTLGDGTFYFENSAVLGMRLKGRYEIGYNQDFNVTPSAPGAPVRPEWIDGYGYVRWIDLWKSADGLTSMTHELQVYTPTHQLKRDRGFLTQVRYAITVTREITDGFSFFLVETPIVHLYRQAGFTGADGTPEANPVFENRVVLEFRVRLAPGLHLGLPTKFYATRFGEFEGSGNGDGWSPFLGFSPGLTLGLGDHLTLGATYHSGNLMGEADYGYILPQELPAGAFQVNLGLSL